MLYFQSISEPINFHNFFESRATLMKLKVPLVLENLTKVNGTAYVQPNIHSVLL